METRFGARSAPSFGVPSIAPPRSVNRGRFERNRPSSQQPMRITIEDQRARREALVLLSLDRVFFCAAQLSIVWDTRGLEDGGWDIKRHRSFSIPFVIRTVGLER